MTGRKVILEILEWSQRSVKQDLLSGTATNVEVGLEGVA